MKTITLTLESGTMLKLVDARQPATCEFYRLEGWSPVGGGWVESVPITVFEAPPERIGPTTAESGLLVGGRHETAAKGKE